MIERRWTISRIALGCVLAIALAFAFLPWLTESHGFVPNPPCPYCAGSEGTWSLNAFGTGTGLLYFLIIFDVAIVFAVRAIGTSKLLLPLADWLLYLIAGVGALGFALLFLGNVPQGYVTTLTSPPEAPEFQGVVDHFSAATAVGWPLALVAATAICATAFLERTKPQPPLGFGRPAVRLVLGIVFVDGLALAIYGLVHLPLA